MVCVLVYYDLLYRSLSRDKSPYFTSLQAALAAMLFLAVVFILVTALLYPTPQLGRLVAWLLRSILTVSTAAAMMKTVMLRHEQSEVESSQEDVSGAVRTPLESTADLERASFVSRIGLPAIALLNAVRKTAKRAVADLDPTSSFDTSLARLVGNDDLGTFWLRLQAAPEACTLSAATRNALAMSLPRTAAVMTDATSALELAISSKDAELGGAALIAGIQLGCGPTWLAAAHTRLSAAKILLRPDQVVMLAKSYGSEGRGDLAVDLWQLERLRCSHNNNEADSRIGDTGASVLVPDLYGAALEACVVGGDLETAARAARSACWESPTSTSGQAAFLTITRWLARRQDVTSALACYNSVRSLSGLVDFQTHRALLTACVRTGDLASAAEVFCALSTAGLKPDFGSFSTMIRGYCAAGELEQAMTLFHLMRRRGFVPDASLFDAILDGCARRNMTTLSEQVLEDMQALGVSLSNQTIATLLRLFGQNRDLSRVLEIFEELPHRNGLEVNTRTYRTLISVCLSNGRLDLAIDAFEKMQTAGCSADSRTYEALVVGCLREGKLDKSVALIDSALGLSSREEGQADRAFARACIEPKVVDDVLLLIGKRGQAHRLGIPLVQRLRGVGFEVSERISQGILRIGQGKSAVPGSLLASRRNERHAWRYFRRTVDFPV